MRGTIAGNPLLTLLIALSWLTCSIRRILQPPVASLHWFLLPSHGGITRHSTPTLQVQPGNSEYKTGHRDNGLRKGVMWRSALLFPFFLFLSPSLCSLNVDSLPYDKAEWVLQKSAVAECSVLVNAPVQCYKGKGKGALLFVLTSLSISHCLAGCHAWKQCRGVVSAFEPTS
jgi:hypothetical protein